jgi:small subunit ribosomal protein S9
MAKAAQKQVSASPVSNGTGRRKKCIARVLLYRNGSGKVTVNGVEHTKYFPTDLTRSDAYSPVIVTPHGKIYDFAVKVTGGGKMGQADAVKLGIARALVAHDEESRGILRDHGMLTVDARVKERKKYGRKAARRGFQFVKR